MTGITWGGLSNAGVDTGEVTHRPGGDGETVWHWRMPDGRRAAFSEAADGGGYDLTIYAADDEIEVTDWFHTASDLLAALAELAAA